jgi:glyoxylate/hydroxypyruvate reductase
VILFYSENEDPAPWREAFCRELPHMPFEVWPFHGPLEAVRYLVVWKPRHGFIAQFPRLKAILALGAGVDPIPTDPTLPKDVPLLRLVDVGFPAQMAEYAAYAVLRFQRRMREYEGAQRAARWQEFDPIYARDFPVGVMGLGVIGEVVARRLAALGYPVAGWTRSPRRVDAIEVFSGRDNFARFLARSQVIVNVLPLTPETENILNAKALAAMPKGAFLVNIGRGKHVVDRDLIDALDSGQLGGAALDVFREEPLPASHPFWRHPGIVLTPHVAAPTVASEVQTQIIENIKRIERGEVPTGRVDLARGY